MSTLLETNPVALGRKYRAELTEDILPFWLKHGIDREHGGIMTALGRDGQVVDTDKSGWFQGRAGWMFATAHNTVEKNPAYLEAAVSCVRFLREKCVGPDGKYYFTVTREGRPLRMRRYAYSECFGAIAHAAVARATGEARYADFAAEDFAAYLRYSFTPGMMAPKTDPATRPSRGIGPLMIGMVTAQDIRADLGDIAVGGKTCSQWAAFCIGEIEKHFVKHDQRAVLEMVTPEGRPIDHFEGRQLNPGHTIEAAWFILREAEEKRHAGWKKLGLAMLDYMWERGWDTRHGGLLYFVDLKGLPLQEYWHSMKFWWPQNEAEIATLMAYQVSGDAKYAKMHQQVHEWSRRHLADPSHGEWYGYLNRDGSPSSELKGSMWKGPFHLPRMLWWNARRLGAL